MKRPQYLTLAAIFLDDVKSRLASQLSKLPGKWDVINLDGTLTTISNKFDKDDCFYGDDFIRIAYVKSFKNNDVDNRTYKQVDSIEAYIRYKLLKNPFLYICDVNIFTDYKMGFDLDSLAEEINVPKRNLIYRCEDEFKIPPYEQK